MYHGFNSCLEPWHFQFHFRVRSLILKWTCIFDGELEANSRNTVIMIASKYCFDQYSSTVYSEGSLQFLNWLRRFIPKNSFKFKGFGLAKGSTYHHLTIFILFFPDAQWHSWHFSWLHLGVTDVRLIYFNLKLINCTVSLPMHILEGVEIDKKKIFIVKIVSHILCCPFSCQFSSYVESSAF